MKILAALALIALLGACSAHCDRNLPGHAQTCGILG